MRAANRCVAVVGLGLLVCAAVVLEGSWAHQRQLLRSGAQPSQRANRSTPATAAAGHFLLSRARRLAAQVVAAMASGHRVPTLRDPLPLSTQARTYLGIARGNAVLPAYVGVVTSDLDALLRWKNRRVPFTDALRPSS